MNVDRNSPPLHFTFQTCLQLGSSSGITNRMPATTKQRRRKNACIEPALEESKAKRTRTTRSSNKKNSSNADTFSLSACLSWFDKYSRGNDVIQPEAMERFCNDLQVQPENVVMLVLAWKLHASRMGYFTQEEWITGMSELQCDSIQKLRAKHDYLLSLLDESSSFRSIYRYAFDFAREKEQRNMDLDTAKIMLTLLLGNVWPLHNDFTQFLEQSKYRVINRDQWHNILEFKRSVNLHLSNYDEDGAWPVLLDEFVEWERQRMATSSEDCDMVGS